MKRFIEGESRTQSILLPASLDDYITDTNPVRVVDVFIDELELYWRALAIYFRKGNGFVWKPL